MLKPYEVIFPFMGKCASCGAKTKDLQDMCMINDICDRCVNLNRTPHLSEMEV